MKFLITIVFFTSFCFASYSQLLFNGNCITCHKMSKNTSAPSIKEIVKNYKNAYPIKKDFVKAMSLWVLLPKQETSIMQDAIKKYKLMPELAYRIDVLQEIAVYLYELDFNK